MEQCTAEEEKDLQCQTISPKMMAKVVEVITSETNEKDEEIPTYLLSRLKSARIVTSSGHGKHLFRKATELMEKNIKEQKPSNEANSRRRAGGRPGSTSRIIQSGRELLL